MSTARLFLAGAVSAFGVAFVFGVASGLTGARRRSRCGKLHNYRDTTGNRVVEACKLTRWHLGACDYRPPRRRPARRVPVDAGRRGRAL